MLAMLFFNKTPKICSVKPNYAKNYASTVGNSLNLLRMRKIWFLFFLRFFSTSQHCKTVKKQE
jgi:hypothetical protein